MALAEDNFDEIKKRIYDAYDNEDPVLQKFREFARILKNNIKPIRTYSVNAVSFVSTDGGDNRLYFNPAVIELVRVVDSRGNQCAIDAIAANTSSVEFNERANETSKFLVPPLKRLCDDLNCRVIDISYILKTIDKVGKSTGAIRTYRDIVEWAVLYDLIKYREWGSDTIIIREGLLRTKSINLTVFPIMDNLIREACEKHKKEKNIDISIVGVAKQNAVLSKLSVALELEETMHKDFPCYVKVPVDIERECYNFDKTWLDTDDTVKIGSDGKKRYQSFGSLFLVKFGDRPFDPVWPVDLAVWQVNFADKTIGQLQYDARPGFPIPDFPMCVQKAHDFAKVNGLEVDILQDLLFEGITRKLNSDQKEKILRIKHLGKNLTNIRYRNA
ncbi:hypothetical protein ACFLR4_01750 [Bacteroidota bacterium]